MQAQKQYPGNPKDSMSLIPSPHFPRLSVRPSSSETSRPTTVENWRWRIQRLFYLYPLLEDVSTSVRCTPICWILGCSSIPHVAETSAMKYHDLQKCFSICISIQLFQLVIECCEVGRSGVGFWCEWPASSSVSLRSPISSLASLVS